LLRDEFESPKKEPGRWAQKSQIVGIKASEDRYENLNNEHRL